MINEFNFESANAKYSRTKNIKYQKREKEIENERDTVQAGMHKWCFNCYEFYIHIYLSIYIDLHIAT